MVINFSINSLSSKGTTCTIEFTPSMALKKPHIYYKLGNFYSSNKNWMVQRNWNQLRGNQNPDKEVKSCKPFKLNKDIHENLTSYTGVPLDPDMPAYPCGSVGYYMYRDKIEFTYENGTVIE